MSECVYRFNVGDLVTVLPESYTESGLAGLPALILCRSKIMTHVPGYEVLICNETHVLYESELSAQ